MGLIVIGGYLIRWQSRQWSETRDDASLEPREIRHFRRQHLRRLLVSALLILLGVMIPAGDALLTHQGRDPAIGNAPALQQRFQALFAIYWIVVLLLTLWIVLLAAVDWLSTRVFVRTTRVALSGLARKRRELEAEIDRLRDQHRNGHS